MDKNAIKKYAVWARRELISRVTQKAYQYGIREGNIIDDDADSIDGKLLTENEKKERQALIVQVNEKGFKQVMEEVAYTWFNRFSALRFMEVNGYLPTHVRVFTDDENNFKPQILTEAIHLELNGLDMDKVYELKEANNNDELFKYLIITQCNALNKILPGMFQKIADYTELLFPDNLLREGSVVEQMIALIPEEDFDICSGGQVEIIGWLYQYYNDERKNEVININKGTVKKEDIPAATQLFTTDWVVRYIVDNSLGRYWIERNPDSSLKNELEYYVTPKNGITAKVDEKITPEELTIFDPCMGSGHFLVYSFEVLMKIYTEYGYSEREAAQTIVEKNLYGLDIDNRAAQLAYFAVMMKARQYDRRFLNRGIEPHVYAICESNHLNIYDLKYFVNGNVKLKTDMQMLINDMKDAKEYGSIIHISQIDFDALFARFDEIQNDISMYKESALTELLPLVQVAYVMSQKYAIVVTNPPYLNKMDAKLKKYVTDNYKDYSGDLFSVFMYRNFYYCKVDGYSGFMIPFVWMFIKTYEKLRDFIVNSKSITTLVQMEYSAFEEATVPICSFVIKNGRVTEKGLYIKLSDFKGGMEEQRRKILESLENKECGYFFEAIQNNFSKIPGSPIAYWVSDAAVHDFECITKVESISETRIGMATANNDEFMRLWYEVSIKKVGFGFQTRETARNSRMKWFPYCKGGNYRKWYGNLEYVVNWENDGFVIQNFRDKKTGRVRSHNYNLDFIFRPGLTFTAISSNNFACRSMDDALFGSGGSGICNIASKYRLPLLGLLNSKITEYLLGCLSLTMNFEVNTVGNMPFIVESRKKIISEIVRIIVELSKDDWDSFETSWDFKRHPMLIYGYENDYGMVDAKNINKISPLQYDAEKQIFEIEKGDPKHPNRCEIENCFKAWKNHCNAQFNQLKSDEEELNRIFIDIYGLQDELKPEEEGKDVTVHYICDSKEDAPESMKGSNYLLTKQDVIKSLISYAVGCMFGRYSLYKDGLLYAGGAGGDFGSLVEKIQDSLHSKGLSRFPEKEFYPDEDNIIPICDDDYFPDDIVGRFVKFVETVYGQEKLEENLKFIADALGGKGTPREIIRKYFLNDFYKDHCKTYKKRPIYWLFDSGKKNGFKALIYMHRYQPDTIARIRTDYAHEQQERYRTTITHLEQRINDSTSTSERVKLNKELEKLQGQAEEIRIYEEKIHHLADQMISIDLDDGVKHNYEIFKDVLAKIK